MRKPTIALALLTALPALAASGGGHGPAPCGGAGHAGAHCAHHAAAWTVHRSCGGGGVYGAAYGSGNDAIDRELRERAARTRRAKDEFARSHPCPAGAAANGSCPGYVVRCAGPDPSDPARCLSPSNQEWWPVAREGAP